MQRRTKLLALVALLASALTLASCGGGAPVVAEQAPPPADILPTPPPLPTFPPLEPTATPPPAPSGESPADAGGTKLLSTDFSTANSLADWEVRDGTDVLGGPSVWEISNGQLRQISDFDGAPGFYPTALVTGDAAWSNYEVRVAAYSSGNEEIGVVVRSGSGGYYVFRFLPDTASAASYAITRFDADTYTFSELATADGPGFANERWYELSVRVEGDLIQASVDGQPVVEVRDSALTQGGAGVYGYAAGQLLFDNFSVLPIAGNR